MQDVKTQAGEKRDRRGPGRPRDRELESKVFQAAVRLYSEFGWSGFTFDAIAKTANVGKAAIYSRWPTPVDLLRQTFEMRWAAMDSVNEGSLRADLIALARLIMSRINSEHGGFTLNFAVDKRSHPEVRAIAIPFTKQLREREMQVVKHAKARGELPQDFDGAVLIAALTGACQAKVNADLSVTDNRIDLIPDAEVDRYVVELVDILLNGIHGFR